MTRPTRCHRQGGALLGLLAATLLVLLATPASGRAAEATPVFSPGSQSFESTQGGVREATLEALHDGEGSPSVAALSGTGLSQELTVSPSLVFPTTTRYMSSELPLTVSNKSDVDVTIWGTNFEGPGSGSFGTSGSNCGGALSVGSSCMIEVRFSPQSEGEQRAFLHINAEGPGGGPTVELSGLAAPAQLQLEPGSFDFGLTPTNEGGERTRMVLRNVGPAATQVGLETSGGAGAFSIGDSDCWGATLPPAGTCSLQVYFRPNETGAYAGQVRASSGGATFGAELSGRGGEAILSASPNPLDFGSAAVGSRGETRTVTIENSGDLPGGFFIAVISGGDTGSFQLLEEDCTGIPVAPGSSCHAVVRFQPTAAGLRKATLSMFGDGEGGRQIPLLGTGIEPGHPTPVPAAHAFGAQRVGTASPTESFTFTDEGGAATELTGALLGGENRDQFRISRDDCSETMLAPGGSCQVGVRFAPDEAGMQSATLRLASTGGVATASLSGFAETATAVSAARSSAPPRVALRLAGRPLHLDGASLRAGTLTCPSDQSCRVLVRTRIVGTRGSGEASGSRSIGPWGTKVTVPAGGSRSLILHLPGGARTASLVNRLRLRWEWRSGSRHGQSSTEVALR
ncbi:MAG TPA: choice-of-anchor D domain-containing protein [Solirubrobacterales bacterium]|jgi:hypothetical protein